MRNALRWILIGVIVGVACPAAGQDITSNLLGHWKLMETSGTNANDFSSTNNDGTYTAVDLAASTPVTGIGALAPYFDGSGDYVSVPNESTYDITGNITVAAWIKVTLFDANSQAVVTKGTSAWRLQRNGTNNTMQFGCSGLSTNTNVNGVTNVNNGQWHHVAGVYNGSTLKLYVDGVQDNSVTATGSISVNGQAVYIGRNVSDTARDWDGNIFDVRIYTRALSAADIAALYNLPSLTAHWKLDESSGTSASDSSGFVHTGTVTGTTTWTTGMLNNGFQFNGSTRIQATGLLGNPKNVSVAAWANLTTADSSGSEIISLGDHFALRLDEGGVAKALFYNGSTYVTATFAQTYAGTGWHHFAATFDDVTDSLKLYVDGVQAASTTTTSSISYPGLGTNTVIGRQGNSGTSNDFTGTLDDVRIYNYALSSTEVADLYGFVGHWKLSETSGTTAADSTVFAKNGTVSGTANWSTRCSGTGVFDFNGSTNYVSITNASNLQPTSSLSITAWIKGDSWGSGSSADSILRKGEDNPNNYQLAIADGKVALILDDSDTGGIRGNTTLTAGEWYHVAATWDGSTVKIYLNGVLDNTPTSRTGTIATDTRPLYIGARPGSDQFDGMIYDVRLYNRALTASEIGTISGLFGHWKLDETSGTTAVDSSLIGNNATYQSSPTLGVSGMDGTAVQFNGTNYAITGQTFSPPSIGTVVFWMKRAGAPSARQRFLGVGGDWEIWQDPDGIIRFDLGGDGDVGGFETTTSLAAANQWYHIAATFNATADTFAIYVDGVLHRSGSITLSPQTSAQLSIAARTGLTVERYQGTLDDLRIYNRILCPSEIQSLYDAGGGAFAGVQILQWVEVQ